MRIRRTAWTSTALVAALMVMVPATMVLAEPPNPFIGSWEAMDDFGADQSTNRLMVGGNLHVVYHEDGLTACLNAYDQFVGGTGTAVGGIDGDTLSFEIEIFCELRGGKNLPVGPFLFEMVYDDLTDTLTAPDGTVFNRQGS